ncbi:MAG: prepilin-type N-terminal cleavage/methylation domain-containing protein, partial [Syntrophales bacterium]|nr:prepilin-type N-terminal cleavage/methylation domain-containing protein [Syntrophales bacterium]
MRKIVNNNGFTLIEIMIAIFILTVALLGLAGVTVSVINGNAFSKEITTATTLAQDKMEEIKGVGYDDAEDEGGTEDYNTIIDYLT